MLGIRNGKPDLFDPLKSKVVNKNKLKTVTRLLLAIAGVSLVVVLFTPIWRIELNAPQYPEGLELKIHANDIKGNVDIINGLNHYIGMKTLHKADFPEFTILPYCILFFAALFIAVAILNRRKWLYASFGLFALFGVISMIDFWRWEYNYGHNLDPNAAIVVPGMAYQPPLIGFKQLLNFGAYSIPDIGGWIFIACGGLLLIGCVLEWKKKPVTFGRSWGPVSVSAALLLLFSSCSKSSDPLAIGKDNCAYCKMTIADPRFGAEIVTRKGRVFKFDDIQCMTAFRGQSGTAENEKALLYYTDFCGNHNLIEAKKCLFLKGSDIKCPMQGQVIAFNNSDSLHKVQEMYKGEKVN